MSVKTLVNYWDRAEFYLHQGIERRGRYRKKLSRPSIHNINFAECGPGLIHLNYNLKTVWILCRDQGHMCAIYYI